MIDMETPLKEQENSLESYREHSSSISEVDVPTPESANLEEEILSQLYRPLEPCYNKCYCKRCCYHCQHCFLKKGLGICYEQHRRRTPKKTKTNPLPASNNRSLSTRTRNRQPKKEKKEKVETEVAADLGLGR
ncbi:tat protein [Simian immunodeficiency virus]|uniref:Protein Tat n=1 Tax=Simian immunodeficiency virus TaxID=11723 RepID=P89158_SIV|nr:tat protein [Simian immunodeficiency virus]AAO67284.1 Tat [Simian immunodeficiency virus]AAO67294.1 Tat [Simian immunodeficiency virus]AAO67299.1 Tat [Simian immunodeficiency virus]AAO67304.1 Tat [Simian immunodeficiency virus]